jgi:hypothetical protein
MQNPGNAPIPPAGTSLTSSHKLISLIENKVYDRAQPFDQTREWLKQPMDVDARFANISDLK